MFSREPTGQSNVPKVHTKPSTEDTPTNASERITQRTENADVTKIPYW